MPAFLGVGRSPSGPILPGAASRVPGPPHPLIADAPLAGPMTFVLLHNPRCSKSRQALQMLEETDHNYMVRDYLKQPLSLDELRILKKRLGKEPEEWIRWGQQEAEGLDREAGTMELLQAIYNDPILMERPILIKDDEAWVGRPDPAEVFGPLL